MKAIKHQEETTMKCEICEDIKSENDPSKVYDPTQFGYLCDKHNKQAA